MIHKSQFNLKADCLPDGKATQEGKKVFDCHRHRGACSSQMVIHHHVFCKQPFDFGSGIIKDLKTKADEKAAKERKEYIDPHLWKNAGY